ncbi:MBL fold metallo-hydrolase [Luteimonas sp. RD2P54]|uniref:MBL fold metallo-hydrolase n=1 Tax=Luteimonas endophytica TaxID=3042023 RepID=A0ABT6J9Y9_9GAMM|nr:MBL fold metallo-hydrolase [Luteimonas endophytica]MDH5823636.1 MBL fold metallo-hydrolase [Luteimonas endophytica]
MTGGSGGSRRAGAGIDRRTFLLGGVAAAVSLGFGVRAARATGGGALRVQRLAWAGVRLQLPGATLFVDPLIDSGVWESALADPIVAVDDAVGDASVLVTHRHPDHFDPTAVAAALGKGGTFVHAAGTSFHPLPANVRERLAPPWEPQLLGDFTATPVTAVDGYGDQQVSWVVSGGGRRILHGGDTMWHGDWWRIGRQLGPFDAVFLPINGARFSWRQPASDESAVLTPEQAMSAATILGAKLLVPIHYGVAGAEGYAEVEDALGRLARAAAPGGPVVRVLRPGEWLDWG